MIRQAVNWVPLYAAGIIFYATCVCSVHRSVYILSEYHLCLLVFWMRRIQMYGHWQFVLCRLQFNLSFRLCSFAPMANVSSGFWYLVHPYPHPLSPYRTATAFIALHGLYKCLSYGPDIKVQFGTQTKNYPLAKTIREQCIIHSFDSVVRERARAREKEREKTKRREIPNHFLIKLFKPDFRELYKHLSKCERTKFSIHKKHKRVVFLCVRAALNSSCGS